MKKLFLIFAIFPLLFSCEDKETEGISTVTPAPHIELLGDDPAVVIKGTEFEDPGVYAEEYLASGDTLTDLEFKKLNDVNTNVPGSYKITYQVNNSEGVPFYINRSVNVADITGYDVFELPTGVYDGIRVGRNAGGDITITKLTTGIYSVSDLMAGYYEQYAGYGPAYGAPGVFVIQQDGTITTELGYVSGWREWVKGENITFDEGTNTISYTMVMESGFSFDVKLTLK
ncbi:BT_2262 family domain-containing protein [Marinilabilia salmonicolor]|uniref:Uncharacterized protein DUF5011 n=1 Tax=Marinilabilia salmonicolor TaxID=989 RepID=A0A368UJ09_9BACT|nr:BT_2262 family domain-containing protein [Marinilabilia salmonicolor]RCW26073.1 uncharacterized protein DUF5011 [Marinilabilia salmonicolor]